MCCSGDNVGSREVVPGLGILVDDRPAACELRWWWEPTPKGHGGALVEVFDEKDG